jgi:hypothetical protein
LIIQCTGGQYPDLIPLAEKLRAVGNGTAVNNAEVFAKDVNEEIRDMKVWPNISLSYSLTSSPSVKKFIAPNRRSVIRARCILHKPLITFFVASCVVDYTSGTQGFTLHTFPSFIRAFIYVLAGGNTQLSQWGLIEWLGVPG